MIVRALDSNGDYTFGKGGANFLANSPAAVAQAVLTALQLLQGEWFLDNTTGVAYSTEVLGMGTVSTFDLAMQEAILGVEGVLDILDYASGVNPARQAAISCTIDTVYGVANITAPYALNPGAPPTLLDVNFILDQSSLS